MRDQHSWRRNTPRCRFSVPGPRRGLILEATYEADVAALFGIPDGDMHPAICELHKRIAYADDPTIGATLVDRGRWRLVRSRIAIDFVVGGQASDAAVVRLYIREEV